ncbi:MAG: SRPBCC family protein [Ornithinimicrobium sp.]
MPEQTIVLSRHIDAPVEQVWDVLTDLNALTDRLSGTRSVHIMTSGPYAVGTRWRQTRTSFGRASTQEMWVAGNDPLRSTVVESSSPGPDPRVTPDARVTWELTPGDGTELRVSVVSTSADEGQARPWSAILGPLEVWATRTAIERDLDDIDAAARALSSAGGG